MTEENKESEERPLFRPAAVEHFADTAQFEQNLHPISYKRWLTRASLALIFIGLLTWVIFGFIPIEAEGVGIAVNAEGLSNVETSFSGIVKTLNVRVGDQVKQGDLLVTLYNPEIEARLRIVQGTIQTLEKRLVLLRLQVASEAAAERKALSENVEAAKFKIQSLEKEIPVLQSDVKNKEDLAAKGLFDSQSLQQSKELLWSKQTDLEKTKANLSNLQFLLKKGYREEEVEALYEQFLQAVQDKRLLETQLRYKSIYSPVTGRVLEWFITPDRYVAAGELIARLEIQGKEKGHKIFYGYLPLEAGKKVRLNAEVEIELTTVKSQEYGAMLGNIVGVSQYAISPENLTRLINNPALIEYFLQKHEAVLEVLIEPQHDPHTISGYRWTSGNGPPIQLTSGTLCTFKGLVEEIRPFLYFFPAWWIKKMIYQHEPPQPSKEHTETAML